MRVCCIVALSSLLASASCNGNIKLDDKPTNNTSRQTSETTSNNTTSTTSPNNTTQNDTTANNTTMPDMGDPEPDMPAVVDAMFGLDARPANPTCVAKPRPRLNVDVDVERVYPDVDVATPIGMYEDPQDTSRWVTIQQLGFVKSFRKSDGGDVRTLLALGDERDLDCCGEKGLLGIAFHPNIAQNNYVYLSYNPEIDGQLHSRISRVTRQADGTLDMSTELTLIEIEQPYGNHNGGMIDFGPDGFLYIAFGDGGSGGDPINAGQRMDTLLGKILRIDVDHGDPYAIPADNPFAGGGGEAEIYAWGLRNPWKFSFDEKTGQLWTGDVGQNAREEINIIERGGNYGWRIREGRRCYVSGSDCDRMDFNDPLVDYPHSDGRSVTGGYVYHGTDIPALSGRYVFADFVSGRLWALGYDPATGDAEAEVIMETTGLGISSFGQDPQTGELYVMDYDPRGRRGGAGIYKVVPGDSPPGADMFPRTLSATGCIDMANPSEPAPGLIPYEPTAPFWSDGADKERFIALPDGEQVTVSGDGTLEFPNGTVFVKNFEREGQRIETRLFMRHDDGIWGGYTYAWRPDGSDADLLDAGEVRDVAGGAWKYPSRAECLACHTGAAGFVLGFESPQLESPIVYDATMRRAPQLDTLAHIDLFDPPLDDAARAAVPGLIDPFGDAPLGDRARAYLHTNCVSCHIEGSTARGETYLDFRLSLGDTNTCDTAPQLGDLGIENARLIAPGAPERSVLLERMKRDDIARMPSGAGLVTDTRGVQLIEQWITSLASCD